VGESFDLSDVVAAPAKALTYFFVSLPGASQSQHAALEGAGGATRGRIRARDGSPGDDALDRLGTLADPSTDLSDLDALIAHVEHPPFDRSQVLQWILLSRPAPILLGPDLGGAARTAALESSGSDIFGGL